MAQDLNAASKKAIARNKLDASKALGVSKGEFETELDAVKIVCGDFIKRVQDNMQKVDLIVTGDITKMSIVEENGGIKILGSPHVAFQDLGVQGSVSSTLAPNSPFSYSNLRPPVFVFREWIKRQNLNLRDNESYDGKISLYADIDGDEALINKVAWGMATNIYKDGFKPQNFFNKEIPQLVDDLSEAIAGFMANQITVATEKRHLPNDVK